MHLYAPERPEISPDRKALLVDGSAVPRVSVFPLFDSRVELTVMLREYESGESFSYTQHRIIVLTSDLDKFFFNYCRDPELVLEHFFRWKPQARPSPKTTREQTQEKIEAQAYVDSLL